METIRFGVVGCGYFGSELARIVQRMEGTEVTAVFGGSDAARLAEELQCKEAATLEELTSLENVDAVIVASPNHVHKEAVMLAAARGKHVFCEKPVALSLSDCRDMLAACRDAGVRFMAGHVMHFMNGVQQVKRWIAEGEIGRPILCHAERTGWEEKQPAVSWKKNVATSGGHLFHHIHELDVLQAIMGPAEQVVMAGGNLGHQGDGFGDEEDALLLTLEFPGGTLGTMQYGGGFRWAEHYIKINGTEGSILMDMKNSKVILNRGAQLTSRMLNDTAAEDLERAQSYELAHGGISYGSPSVRVPGWLITAMTKELKAFRDALQGKPAEDSLNLLFDGSAALTSIATAEAAMRSMREKRWIAVESIH
ncbi:Gfo/Idh/MocA family protein [Paenibacillus sp. NPDC056579]|uniref:Gfo/Idh/MocA family protein n=1 Tax=Paenibacillus sp. NPDC056579 TaxID=3345871 RepID=UPI0036CFD5DB